MQLTNYLTPEHLLLKGAAADKYELLSRMVDIVCRSPLLERANLDPDNVRDAVFAREKERSTALGEGVALPHARIPGFKGVGLAIATMDPPLDFGDGELVTIVCLVLAPQEQPTISLKVLSQLTRFFSQTDRDKFIQLSSPEEAWEILSKSDLSLNIPVYAKDIMEPPGPSVSSDMPLAQVTRLMFEHHLEAIPVIDENKCILGEITCNRLFRFGLPDFFRQLKSVSFISEFDPFEKYFAEESKAKAGDLMHPDTALHAPDATLLEVIFDLAVKHFPQIYVIDKEGRWLGSINRSTVLNNVIRF